MEFASRRKGLCLERMLHPTASLTLALRTFGVRSLHLFARNGQKAVRPNRGIASA